MADETVQVDLDARRREEGADHRKAFLVGTLLGAGAGVVTAFLNAPRSGRATRADIQQGFERVLFKALDMRPTQTRTGADVDPVSTTELSPAAPPRVALDGAAGGVPADIVIDGPRHADLHA